MAKIQLGAAPKTFKQAVKFIGLDGVEAVINVEFNYRTRTEFADFVKGLYPAIPMTEQQALEFDAAAVADKEMDTDAEYILGAVKSWDLADDLSIVNAKRLANEYPAAVIAIKSDYRDAIVQGRRKN